MNRNTKPGAMALRPMHTVQITIAITRRVRPPPPVGQRPERDPADHADEHHGGRQRAEGGVADAELGPDAVEGLGQREPLALLEHERGPERDDGERAVRDRLVPRACSRGSRPTRSAARLRPSPCT